MAKKIKTIDEMPVDTVEAVKRGILYRGFIPRKYRRHSQLATEEDRRKLDEEATDGDVNKGGEKSKPKKTAACDESESKDKSDQKKSDAESSESGEESSSQETAKDPDEPEPGEIHEKLIDITEKAHDELFKAMTVFPFTPLPNKISLDREKLTVIHRNSFMSERILTAPISSMISAEVSLGPFFGSVEVTSKYFVDNKHTIEYLKRKDAQTLHSLLQGFILAHERGLDVSEIDKEDLRVLLEDLGKS